MNFHLRTIIRVLQPAEPRSRVDMTVLMTARNATLGEMAGLRREHMEFAILGVADRTRPAAIAVKLHAMARVPVSFAENRARSAAFIQSVTNSVRNRACHVLRTVRGPVHIADAVRYRAQYLATSCHAQSAVKRR